MSDKERGIYRKYHVERLSDGEGKHKNCHYYVLDLNHDRHAIPALRAYADSCAAEYPELATDLRNMATAMEQDRRWDAIDVKAEQLGPLGDPNARGLADG